MTLILDGTSGVTFPDSSVISGGYTAKAWVKYTSVTTTAITDSGNVSSLTDNGTGLTTITFSNATSSASYAVSGTAAKNNATNNGDALAQGHGYNSGASNANTTTTTDAVTCTASTGGVIDTVASIMVIQ